MDKNPELVNEIKGHKNTILSAKFSPDNRNLIFAGVEGAIYFHKLNQPNYHYKVFAHEDVIYSLDYGEFKNVHFFLSASRDKTVKLWKIKSIDKEIINQEFEPIIYRNSSTVRFVNISPLNSSIFCTGSDDKTVKIWYAHVPNKRLNTFTNHTNWIRCCKFSKKDSNLLASCGDDSTMRLFDLRINGLKGSILKTITTSRNRHFTYLDWHPLSEHFIAIASSNNTIRIFDLRKMTKIIQFYKPFNDSVNCLEFHPNGQYLLACSSDATCKLINVIEGRLLYTLKGHFKSIFNCTFNRDGTQFSTSGKDKSSKLWNFNLTDDTSSIDLSDIEERAYDNYLKWDPGRDDFERDNFGRDNFERDNLRGNNKSLNNLIDLNENSTMMTNRTNRLLYKNRSISNLCSNQFTVNNQMEDQKMNSNFNYTKNSIDDKNLTNVGYKSLDKNLNEKMKHPIQRSMKNLINLELINETKNHYQNSLSNPLFNDHFKQLNQCNYSPVNQSTYSIDTKLNQTDDSLKLDCIFSQLNLLEDSLSHLERRLLILETKLI